MQTLLPTLSALVMQLPVLLVWLIGLILAIVFWKRHPKVSLFTIIGVSGLLLLTLINTYLNLWLPLMMNEGGVSATQIGITMGIKGIVTSVLSAIFWAFIFVAILGWRKKPEVVPAEVS
jgi:hypothetical protein